MAIQDFVAGNPLTAVQMDTIGTALNTGLETGTYTPTLSGMAIGTGGGAVNSASYNYTAGILYIVGTILFGTSGTTFPTAPTISLPAGYELHSAISAAHEVGSVTMGDATGELYNGVLWSNNATTVRPLRSDSAAANTFARTITTTAPFTWAAGDNFRWSVHAMAVKV